MALSQTLGNNEIVIAAELRLERFEAPTRHVERASGLSQRRVQPEARLQGERQFDRHERIESDFRQWLRAAHVLPRHSQDAREFFDHDFRDRAPRALGGLPLSKLAKIDVAARMSLVRFQRVQQSAVAGRSQTLEVGAGGGPIHVRDSDNPVAGGAALERERLSHEIERGPRLDPFHPGRGRRAPRGSLSSEPERPTSSMAPQATASAGSPTDAPPPRKSLEKSVGGDIGALPWIADDRGRRGKQNEVIEFQIDRQSLQIFGASDLWPQHVEQTPFVDDWRRSRRPAPSPRG